MSSVQPSNPAGPEGLNTGVRRAASSREVASPTYARGRWLRTLRLAFGAISLLLAGCALALYAIRPTRLDPITLLPVWLWIVPGLLLSLAALSRRTLVWSLVSAAAWGIFLGYFAEEPRFLARSLQPPRETSVPAGNYLRIVTLNCDRGNLQAVAEALAQDADIVLLAEIPQRRQLRAIVEQRPGWQMVATPEVAVLVRGTEQFVPVSVSDRGVMCPALVWPARFSGPSPLFVVAVHLLEPVPHPRFGLRSLWSEALRIRTVSAGQMSYLTELVSRAPAECPVLVGGDFNTPTGDRLYAPLAAHLQDAFAQAGRGWPDTYSNALPLVRIDRVWADRRFTVTSARVLKTEHSDHRMVTVELGIGGG